MGTITPQTHRGRWPVKHPDRFWQKVEKTETCWIWHGTRDTLGYGKYYLDGKQLMAHRVAYEMLVGPIPDGTEMDHLCRNPSCINPAHLEPVSHRVNVLRGEAPSAKRAKRTHCIRGHEFTAENTYMDKRGRRQCRACMSERRRSEATKAYKRRIYHEGRYPVNREKQREADRRYRERQRAKRDAA